MELKYFFSLFEELNRFWENNFGSTESLFQKQGAGAIFGGIPSIFSTEKLVLGCEQAMKPLMSKWWGNVSTNKYCINP